MNEIAENYLPKKFGDYFFTKFRPDFKLLSLSQLLLTNNDLGHDTIYSLSRFLLNNSDSINSRLKKQFRIKKLSVDPNIIRFVNYHEVTLQLFFNYGFITFNDSRNCANFVGVKKCNNDTLKQNGFD